MCTCMYIICVIYVYIDFTFCLGVRNDDASKGDIDKISTGHLLQHSSSLTCTVGLQYTILFIAQVVRRINEFNETQQYACMW